MHFCLVKKEQEILLLIHERRSKVHLLQCLNVKHVDYRCNGPLSRSLSLLLECWSIFHKTFCVSAPFLQSSFFRKRMQMFINLHEGTCPDTLLCVAEMKEKQVCEQKETTEKQKLTSFLNTSHYRERERERVCQFIVTDTN